MKKDINTFLTEKKGKVENITTDNIKSISKAWNLEGTVYYMGSDCAPGPDAVVPPCSGPYAGYEVVVYHHDKHSIAAKMITDENGRYRIFLTPGNYTIDTQAGPFPTDIRVTSFEIKENQSRKLDLYVNEGIM